MSALLTGMVLERFPARDLSCFTVALVLADFADHDGRHIYPSMSTIGALSRTSCRHARRIVGSLVEMGFIIQESPGGGRGNPAKYRIDLGWLQAQVSVLGEEKEKGDMVSGFSKTRTSQANQDTATSGFERETRTKPGQNPDTRTAGDPRPITPVVVGGGRTQFSLPAWVPASTWADFEEHRREKGKPLTDAGRAVLVRGLEQLRAAGNDPRAVIEQTVIKGWDRFYPVRESAAPAASRKKAPSIHDERAATLAALTGGRHGHHQGERHGDIIDQ